MGLGLDNNGDSKGVNSVIERCVLARVINCVIAGIFYSKDQWYNK